jgi:hypothetical protein
MAQSADCAAPTRCRRTALPFPDTSSPDGNLRAVPKSIKRAELSRP